MSQLNFRKDFSPQAVQVVENATIECMRMMHDYVGTEHLLLGLLMVTDSEASKIIAKQGITIRRLGHQVDLLHGRRDYVSLEPSLRTSARRTLYLAWQHAMLAGGTVNTEHILLAILKKEGGNKDALRILKRLRVDLGLLHADLMKVLESQRSGNDFARWLRQPDEDIGESNE